MKIINKGKTKIIVADEGKQLISVKNKKMLEDFNGKILPGFNPVYFKEINVSIDYTEEQMNEDFIEEDIK